MQDPSGDGRRGLLSAALSKIEELKARLLQHEQNTGTPVAIIGMACRFPGGANSPDQWWDGLVAGLDAVTEVPAERWSNQEWVDPDPAAPGRTTSRHGAFLEGVDRFDAAFFGVAPRDARAMDPQHRLLLELAWEAIERAGLDATALRGARVGVFVGLTTNDYARLLEGLGPEALSAYTLTGNPLNFAAGRISYALGLTGPAIGVDTACSSSLVAAHLAISSLRRGECDLALAGGANLMLSPHNHVVTSKAGMLSPSGRCRAFDAAADGIVRAEGAGFVLLQRDDDARRDGAPVIARVLASAVNQDGASAGLTVPNLVAQEALIRAALAEARLKPAEVGYVEAHGTGTPLGDPVELRALGAVYGADRDQPLWVGTAKANIGHAESAAGVAGLIKAALVARWGLIPPHLHLNEPTPHVDWRALRLALPRGPVPWSATPRRAAVSSFGASGTNAHLILEAPAASPPPPEPPATAHLLTLSARSEPALRELAGRWARHLDEHPEDRLCDLTHTAGVGRARQPHRLAAVAEDRRALSQQLEAFAAEGAAPGIHLGHGSEPDRVVFLFTGQGAHTSRMGEGLFQEQPVFRQALREAAEALDPHLPTPLLGALYPDQPGPAPLPPSLHQPALFALQVALCALWRSLGVRPDAVLGHSAGELAAAVEVGTLSLEHGAALVAERARLMAALPSGGLMVAVRASPEAAQAAIHERGPDVSIAAINAPDRLVISGPAAPVMAVAEALGGGRALETAAPFHSEWMNPALEPLHRFARTLPHAAPRIPVASTLTGRLETGGGLWGSPEYWARHAREPVRLYDAATALGPAPVLVEVGPHGVLLGLLAEQVGSGTTLVPSLRRDRPAPRAFFEAAAQLFAAGVKLDRRRLDAPLGARRVSAPTYPFEYKHFWLEQSAPRGVDPAASSPDHPLLGRRLDLPGSDERRHQATFTPLRPPFLDHHRLFETAVMPAAAWVALVLAGAQEGSGPVSLELRLEQALVLHDEDRVRAQWVVGARQGARWPFRILSGAGEPPTWTEHASGALFTSERAAEPPARDLECWRQGAELDGEAFYEAMRRGGYTLGPAFRWIQRLWARPGLAMSQLGAPELPDAPGDYPLHPGLIDSCFQTLAGAVMHEERQHAFLIPARIERFTLLSAPAAGAPLFCLATCRQREQGAITGDLELLDASGEVLATVTGFQVRATSREALLSSLKRDHLGWMWQQRWIEAPAEPPAPASTPWILVGDGGGLGARLAATLQARGSAVVHLPDEALPSETEGWRALLEAQPEGAGLALLTTLDLPLPESWGSAPSEALLRSALLAFVQALGGRPRPGPAVVVTRGGATPGPSPTPPSPLAQAAHGLLRTARTERPDLRLLTLDLGPTDDAEVVCAELDRLTSPGPWEQELALRGPGRFAPRLTPLTRPEPGRLTTPGGPWRLGYTSRGSLDNLRLSPLRRLAPGPGEIEIEVEAVGLNFRDVLGTLGLYPGDPGPLGGECAGRVSAVGPEVEHLRVGDPVVGMFAPDGCFASFARVPAPFAARCPAGLSAADAVTLPVAAMTALYGLEHLAKLKAGERVLIHTAAGGVGLAAMAIARSIGAEIHATAGSAEKRALLLARGAHAVYSSRDPSFAEQLQAQGGVDVVLSALSPELTRATLGALAPGARFVEIGKASVLDDAAIAAIPIPFEYHHFDLARMAAEAPELVRDLLNEVVDRAARGALRPLPRVVFDVEDAPFAFQHMAAGRHTGKIVSRASRGGRPVEVAPEGRWLITGGLGALGQRVAGWLVERGARHLLLVGRDAPGPEASARIQTWTAAGVSVSALRLDLGAADAEQRLRHALSEGPPLKGVLHLAGALHDDLLERQTEATLRTALAPKLDGVWAVHRATLGEPVEVFALFSSMSARLGGPGQANYAAANAALDGFARWRRSLGLPATSVGWGPWADEGMGASTAEATRVRWTRQGITPLPPGRALEAFVRILALDPCEVGVLDVRWPALRASAGGQVPRLLDEVSGTNEGSAGQAPLVQLVARTPAHRREEALLGALRARVARVLGVRDPRELPADQPLRTLGLDSLMAVELRNDLSQGMGRAFSIAALFDHPTLLDLARHLASELATAAEAERTSAPGAAVERVSTVATAAVNAEDAVAVLGMACRLPGGADEPEALWRLLEEGRDGIVEVPHDRWDNAALYHPERARRGRLYTTRGGFLEHIDRFEPAFFGISPAEAMTMDPHQRLLLEVSWEALERAGLAPDRLKGSRTGVFVGQCFNDYALGTLYSGDPRRIDGTVGTGTAASVTSGRISYVLGLQGPTLTVDTACSTSLVAIHLAASALLRGEADLALAGGASLLLSPETTIYFCQLEVMSPTGQCRAFSADANGYVRSEGCGVVVLKRLSDAIRDGDPVLAVIRGTAVNHDGRSNGLTSPNGAAQQAVIRAALDRAGVPAASIDYLEAHGTGTAIGDPIEAEAAAAALGEGHSAERPLWMGSIKSNLGHTEGAAGVSSFMKVVLALRHRAIPPSLHVQAPSPHIPWDRLPIRVVTALRPWPAEGARRAGVSSFGISGTNAHVIVEEAPETPRREGPVPTGPALVVFSGRTDEGLRATAARLEAYLRRSLDVEIFDIAYSLLRGRAQLETRAAFVADSTASLVEALGALGRGEPRADLSLGHAPARRPRIVFLFPGQGSQWPGMGRELLTTSPAFRAELERIDPHIRSETGWSVLERLMGPPEELDGIDVIQPTLFAMSLGLVAAWRALGVRPDRVIGHSMGEVAAAVVAGALDLADAASVICRRSRLLKGVAGQGGMAVVELGLAEAERRLAGLPLSVAASNSPDSTVIAGDPAALGALLDALEAEGVFARRIRVDVASHSPQMDPLTGPLLDALEHLSPREPSLEMWSTVRGGLVEGPALDPRYWMDNLRQPVRFADAVDAVFDEGDALFVELSPHPLLVPTVDEARRRRGRGGVVVPSTRRDRPERQSQLESLGALFVAGLPLDWRDLYPSGGQRVDLPTNAWVGERYWIPPRRITMTAEAQGHPLLGPGVSPASAPETRVWERLVRADDPPWLSDHRVEGAVVMPAAALAELALSAARDLVPTVEMELTELRLSRPLVLTDAPQRLQVELTRVGADAELRVRISARPAEGQGAPVEHASGALGALGEWGKAPPVETLRRGPASPGARLYEALRSAGLEHGPAFQGVVELWQTPAEGLARLALPEAAGEAPGCFIHPALLDAVFQVAALVLGEPGEAPAVPSRLRGLRIWGTLHGPLWVRARRKNGAAGTLEAELWVVDERGRLVLALESLEAQRLVRPAAQGEVALLQERWVHAPIPEATGGRVIVVGQPDLAPGLREAVAAVGGVLEHIPALTPEDLRRGPVKTVVHAASTAPVDHALMHDPGAALRTIQAVIQAGLRDPPRLVLMSRGARALGDGPVSMAAGALVGLWRCLSMEHPETRPLALDLAPAPEPGEAEVAAAVLTGEIAEDELACRAGQLWAARVEAGPLPEPGEERLVPAGDRPWRLEIPAPGVLDRLAPRPCARPSPGPGQVEIQVEAAGINFLDVLLALGALPADLRDAEGGLPIGGECAGRISALGEGVSGLSVGDRVMALAPWAFAPWVIADARLVAPAPARLSAAEAAAMPVAGLTALFGLERLARLEPGERVLIHAAAGGVGQIAFDMAKRLGAEIHTTAGTPEKRAWLLSMGARSASDSRSDAFVAEVMAATGGEGVDVVLNSLSGELLDASLRLLRDHGRFVELGKRDAYADHAIALRPFLKNLSFTLLDLRGMAMARPERVGAALRELSERLSRGELSPPPVRTAPVTEAVNLFRDMASGRHTGKLVLTLDGPPPPLREAGAAGALNTRATWLITGGTGGLGLSLAGHLAARGVERIVLLARRAPGEAQREGIARVQAAGSRVEVRIGDVSNLNDLTSILSDLRSAEPPLRGIVHAAGTLDDGLLAQQSPERLRGVMGPKALGAWHLHQLTRDLPLEHFVLYGSAAGMLGSPGQGGYCAANTALDALALERVRLGLPAQCLGWGLFKDVGLAARDERRAARLEGQGMRAFSPAEGLVLFDRLLGAGPPTGGIMALDARQWVEVYPAAAASRRLAPLVAGASQPRRGDPALLESLRSASPTDRPGQLQSWLLSQLSAVLRLPPSQLSAEAPLSSLGLDSLMGLELRNRVEGALGLRVPATVVWTYPTLARLSEHLAQAPELSGPPALGPTAAPVAPEADDDTLAAVTALDEAAQEALLDEQMARMARMLDDDGDDG